jgi:hypothetical protein
MPSPVEQIEDLLESARTGEAGDSSVSEHLSDREMTIDRLLELVRMTEEAEHVFEHIDVLASLSKADYGRVRGQLKDATDVNLNQLDAAIREAREKLNEKRRREEVENYDVPTVQVTGHPSSEIVDDLCEAIEEANDPPTWFQRKGGIVHVADEKGRLQIEEISDALFDDRLARCSYCVDEQFRPQDPPRRLVNRVAERVDLPPLRGVARVPFLRPDGTACCDPGYDEWTKQLYRPDPEMGPISVSEEPSSEDVKEAVELLEEAWTDHPFTGEASWTNMVALALTPVVRPLLGDANVPLGIIDAPSPGSGKDLAAQIAALASTGQFPGTMNDPSGDDEWRKQITAQLRRGERFIVVSDLTGTLDNAPLRRVLTTPVWSDRILGVTRQVRLPADPAWCATGNNLRPRGDMVRRCYLIRIDTGMEQPWTRTGFKYQQPQWAREHRGELAAALLTLARAWIAAGRPEPNVSPLGSFEQWCRVIGGILQHAGFENFLGNQDELSNTEFSEDDEWSLLLEAIDEWQEKVLDGEPFTARKLAEEIEEYRGERPDSGSSVGPIVEHLPENLQRKVRQEEPVAQSLGKTLGWKKNRRFPGGWFLTSEGRGREGTRWVVRRDEVGDEPASGRRSPT